VVRVLVGAAARGRPQQYSKEIAAVLPASLAKARFSFDLHDGDDDWDPSIAEAEALVLTSRGLGEAAVASASRLRFVQKLGQPVDGAVLRACRDRGIVVSVLPDAGHVAVAEHTLALVLAAARNLVATHEATRRGENPAGLVPVRTTQTARHVNWLAYPEDDFRLLADQTLGLVGFGAIAREFAPRAAPLFERVVYTKRQRLAMDEEARWGITYAPMADLLAQADVVCLLATQADGHPPILGATQFAQMKRGAWLVNTARGNQVDQAALVRALGGHLGGVALDVFETEPVLERDLLDLPNVLLSPHTANLMPTGRRFAPALANIERVWAGRPPLGVV
jgi:phosphoglycerate dehydrogenase-like enzyme